MPDTLVRFKTALDESAANRQLRVLKSVVPVPGGEIEINGSRFINFASNDYLGLSQHPFVKRLSAHYLNAYGAGTCSSRLLSGNIAIYERIENDIAALKGTESALIFATGFQANSTILSTLAQTGAVIASDRDNHASIAQALRLTSARWFRYQHNDLSDLDKRLSDRLSAANAWIVSETLFSMDGDEIDIETMKAIATRYGATLYLDEAHAIGVRGPDGFGLKADGDRADVFLGTFGKACGSFGAFIACPQVVKDYLVNMCPGLIYSTALPPAVLGAVQAAIELIPTLGSSRRELAERGDWLRGRLRKLGYETLASSSQIIPLVMGSNESALKLAQHLEERGIFAPAIRPPTVPDGLSRVRISLTLSHTFDHLSLLLDSLGSFRERCL